MPVSKKKLLEELNKDLEWEYAAAIQYVQHASVMTGAQYESIQKELVVHSQEEMQHALMLSEQIDFLGGTPTVDVEKREVSANTLEMLKQDLAGEEMAINRYKKRIEQAEQLFACLKLLGRQVEFVRFEGESHGLSRGGRPQNRTERLRRMVAWFDKHLSP